jgi:hypothetical protein
MRPNLPAVSQSFAAPGFNNDFMNFSTFLLFGLWRNYLKSDNLQLNFLHL